MSNETQGVSSNHTLIRFSETPFVVNAKPANIMIVGVGGSGSPTAYYLGGHDKHDLVFIDMDQVERHNRGTQMFRSEDDGRNKVDALKRMIEDTYDVSGTITTHTSSIEDLIEDGTFHEIFDSNDKVPVVITCLDSMTARKNSFRAWLDIPSKEKLFIDPRLSTEAGYVYFVRNTDEDIAAYTETLCDDSEVEAADCTVKQSKHGAAQIGVLCTSGVLNHLMNTEEGIEYRKLPFFSEFNLGNFEHTHMSLQEYLESPKCDEKKGEKFKQRFT